MALLPLGISLGLILLLGWPEVRRVLSHIKARVALLLPSPLIGRVAPTFHLTTLDGGVLTDADLRKGRVTVLNIFASWCEDCRLEVPALSALAEMREDRVQIIGIAQKDNPEDLRRFLNVNGTIYSRVALDPAGRAAIDWGVYGVPETFVIRGDGVVAYKFIGALKVEEITSVIVPQIRKALQAR